MNKALFWDFDGTLVHSRVLWSGAVYRALCECCPDTAVTLEQIRGPMRYGFTWHTPEEDYTACIGPAWWERMFRRFEDIYAELGVDEETARRASVRVRCLIFRPENYTLYADTLDTLLTCRAMGWRNVLLSNNYPELPAILDALGLTEHFDGVVVSALVGWDKPRREIYEYARNLAGNPKYCIMIGDNPMADIAGARAVGIHTIHVHSQDPGCLGEPGPKAPTSRCSADFCCDELAKIPAWLQLNHC